VFKEKAGGKKVWDRLGGKERGAGKNTAATEGFLSKSKTKHHNMRHPERGEAI